MKNSEQFNMKYYELGISKKYNFSLISGTDEVGRGPLAGPVVAASVILPIDYFNPDINDSKKISAKKREKLYKQIISDCICYSIVEINNNDIDKLNIHKATKKAMELSIQSLEVKPEYILTDFMKITSDVPQLNLIKGDSKSISIAASSIIAKVYRDNLMKNFGRKYSYYEFEKNMGYGTKKHLEALKEHGFCPIHRKSFSPVKNMLPQKKHSQGLLFK